MRHLLALVGFLCVSVFAQSGFAQPIDAARFVDPVTITSVSLSPSGQYLAFVRQQNDSGQVIIADLNTGAARVLSTLADAEGRVNWVDWKTDDRVILSASSYQTAGGDRNRGATLRAPEFEYVVTRLYSMPREGGQAVAMFEGRLRTLVYGIGSTFLINDLPNEPGHVLLSAWDNNGHGVWRAEVATGRVERVIDGTWDTMGYMTDGAGTPVLRWEAITDGSGYRVSRRTAEQRNWTFVLEARRTATATNSPDFEAIAPGPGANQVYVIARPDTRDLAALYLFNTATGEFGQPIQEGEAADVSTPWIHPVTAEVLATCEFGARQRCTARQPGLQRHLNAIETFFDNNVTVRLMDMSADENRWVLYVEGPQESGGYFLYDRTAARVDLIGALYPNLETSALSPVSVVNYQARDGQTLWAYVTTPTAPSAGPRPMIVMPHGGPEYRDYFGYDSYSQFLASRGYVVVQPNFRGSLGFGRAFGDAGRGQWGLRMQDDVTDAVRHMIATGVADPERICIVGASYGGYAALAGVTYTPELYQCAVSIAGVSDLLESLRSERADGGRNSTGYHYWMRSIGDPRSNREGLIATSPARNVDRINAPVLLIHGEDDVTVPIDQSEIMDRALRQASKPVRFVRLPDSDHYWGSWSNENRLTLYRETEAFLAQHLGAAN